MQKQIQRGISLLEVMLSLAIIAIILVMATRYYQSAQQSQQVSNSLSIIHGIVTAEVQWAAANNNTYTGNIGDLTSNGYLPTSATNSPWGQAITLGDSSSQIKINFGAIPSVNACNALNKILTNEGALTNSSCGGLIVTYN